MSDVRDYKDALARLAADEPVDGTDRDPIVRAVHSLDDLAAAADFVERVGLDVLADAVEVATGERARRGREALAAFRRYRAVAADGDASGRPTLDRQLRDRDALDADRTDADRPETPADRGERTPAAGCYFRRGHDTHLGRARKARSDDTGDPHR